MAQDTISVSVVTAIQAKEWADAANLQESKNASGAFYTEIERAAKKGQYETTVIFPYNDSETSITAGSSKLYLDHIQYSLEAAGYDFRWGSPAYDENRVMVSIQGTAYWDEPHDPVNP